MENQSVVNLGEDSLFDVEVLQRKHVTYQFRESPIQTLHSSPLALDLTRGERWVRIKIHEFTRLLIFISKERKRQREKRYNSNTQEHWTEKGFK